MVTPFYDNSYEINVNFSQAKAQADKLEGVSSQLRSLATGRFDDTMQSIGAYWQCDARDKFLQKEEQIQSDMIATADYIANLAANIRNTAQTWYNTEMNNLAILRAKHEAELAEEARLAELAKKEEAERQAKEEENKTGSTSGRGNSSRGGNSSGRGNSSGKGNS